MTVPGAADGRIPRFDSIPSVITSSIEASKAVTPATPGAPTLGHINIRTFSPFDKEGFGVSASLAKGERTLADRDIDRYALRLSYSTDNYGILAFTTSDERGRSVDNREYGIDAEAGTLDNLDFRQYGGERENYSYGGKIETRPDNSALKRAFISTLYYEFNDDEERNQYDFNFDEEGTQSVPLNTSGIIDGVEARLALEQGRYETSTFTNTIGVDLEVGNWLVEPRLTYTETEDFQWLPIVNVSSDPAIDGFYDITDIYDPVFVPYFAGTTNPIPNLANIPYAEATLFNIFNGIEIDSMMVQVDASTNKTLFGHDTEIKTGLAFDSREGEGNDFFGTFSGGFESTFGVNVADFATDNFWDADFDNTIPAVYYDNPGLFAAARANGLTAPDPTGDDGITLINEDILNAYVQGTTTFDWGSLVYGVRVESTDFSTTGNSLVDGVLESSRFANDYVNILPSLHLNYNLRDDLKLRLSATSGISRPNYFETRASQSVDALDMEVSGGNPLLDPEESYGLDASLEWYFDEASLVSVGAFYRSIDNVIYAGASTVDGSVVAPNVFAPGQQVAYSSFFNGEDGELSGFEFNFLGQATFLPEPFDGLGATANVTITDSEFFAPTEGANGITSNLPGTSDLIYNASIFYEKFGVSARLSYQWRDEWLTTTEATPGEPLYWGETERVNAKIQYQLPYSFGGGRTVVFLEGNNLSDYNDTRYVGSEAFADQVEGYGRSFVLGVSYDF